MPMQDFRHQASRNGVTLLAAGPCQFCGAAVERGVEQCLELLGGLSGLLRAEKNYAQAHLLSLHAHALQHPEIHGRLSSHVHLLSMCLILERDFPSAVGTRLPPVEKFLASGLPAPQLVPPPPGRRGSMTVSDVAAASADRRPDLARAWARETWEAWRTHHPWARRALDRLLHD